MRFVLHITLAVAMATSLCAADSIEIPLESIWALDIPKTRDIEGMDLPAAPQSSFPGWGFEEFKNYRQQAIERLHSALSAKPPSADALAGFVVSVSPERKLLAVLNNEIIQALNSESSPVRQNSIQSGRNAFLIFYSHPSSYYVRLKSVTRQGKTIEVSYAFEPHYTVESTVHFAMIPLGKLEAGEYQVRFSQQLMDQKFMDAGFIRVVEGQAKRFVCRPFSFIVYDPPAPETEEDPVSERIPLDRIWALHMPATRDVRELGTDDVTKIGSWLFRRSEERVNAGSCFLVTGEGKKALQNAAKVLVEGEVPAMTLPAGKNISLFFYSYTAPGYVHLHSVRHSNCHVTVRYQVVRHQSSEVTVHFALIPLDKLSPGKITVESVEVASETPYSNHALTDRAVCDSCTFVVQDGGTQ